MRAAGASPKEHLVRIFRAAVGAAKPALLVEEALRCAVFPAREGAAGRRGSFFLVGGGKAGVGMVEGALAALDGRVEAGVVAVPRGCGGFAGPVRLVEAGHPFPDAGSRLAARGILGLLSRTRQGHQVVAVLSGGGSAMISLPPPGVTAAEKNRTCALLLEAGADIASLNAVRKHLSLVKGGWAARAGGAAIFAVLLSDVPGDDPSVIASGPFVPDPSTYADAIGALGRFGVLRKAPGSVRRRLAAGAAGRLPETPKPGDPAFSKVTWTIAGSNRTALEGAGRAAAAAGAKEVRLFPSFLRGEARECGRAFAALVRTVAAEAPKGRRIFLAAGGETTVRVKGKGKGGRCQEFALAAAIELEGTPQAALLCAGTDGKDGPVEAAGAYADGTTCERARRLGLDPLARLADNDAGSFFEALGDLVVTGPTGTNVADVALCLLSPGASS